MDTWNSREAQTPFGIFLRKARLSAGFGVRELARKADISFSYVSRLEHGDSPPPGKETLDRIITVLNLDKAETYKMACRMPDDIKAIVNNPVNWDAIRQLLKGN